MSDPRTVIDDALASIATNPRDTAVLCLVIALAEHDDDAAERAVAYLAIAAGDPTTILPRARDIAARVADLNVLDRAHPGLASQEQVREERERLIAEIGRLLDGREWARGEGS